MPARTLTEHKVNLANDKLEVIVTDEPGAGGANHRYLVSGLDTSTNPSLDDDDHITTAVILFQNGPISEAGINGITQEVLLAIIADRLRAFQAGPYACAENGRALEYVRAAQAELQSRTKGRMARGVEGTHAI